MRTFNRGDIIHCPRHPNLRKGRVDYIEGKFVYAFWYEVFLHDKTSYSKRIEDCELLEAVELKYNPNQQGDKEEDI